MRTNTPSKRRKQLLAAALAVGLLAPAVAATPAAAPPLPQAQFLLLFESMECGPYDLDVRCSGDGQGWPWPWQSPLIPPINQPLFW